MSGYGGGGGRGGLGGGLRAPTRALGATRLVVGDTKILPKKFE